MQWSTKPCTCEAEESSPHHRIAAVHKLLFQERAIQEQIKPLLWLSEQDSN